MHSKGQVWSVDFIVAAIVLSIIFLLFILMLNTLSIRWSQYNTYRQMQTDAFFASESLLTTPGDPRSWEMLGPIDGSNISAIGLANGRNELNNMKLDAITTQNASAYSFVKERLGLSRYDFWMNISDMNMTSSIYVFGKQPGPSSNTVALQRMALINGTPVIVRLEVWD